MKKIIILLIISSTILFGKVPSWFIETPETPAGIYLAVGYTDNFFDRDLARRVAVDRAINTMAKQKQLNLLFSTSNISDGRFVLGKPNFEEIYEEAVFNEMMENHMIVDSVFLGKQCFFLVQYPASSNPVKVNTEIRGWGPKPSWIDTLPENGNYIYGLGATANYVYFARGWKDTDSFARFDVGKNIFIKVENWLQDSRGSKSDRTNSQSSQFYDISIFNCKVVKRWYDKEQDIFYSLCRLPKNSYQIN
ncbi:MAG: hypothetical protein JXQ65_06365 [Candidatus Marinimicrobia bacterium]|nr:hypothetical protein [Candidatus Neomarinimicrobiota bacterium]